LSVRRWVLWPHQINSIYATIQKNQLFEHIKKNFMLVSRLQASQIFLRLKTRGFKHPGKGLCFYESLQYSFPVWLLKNGDITASALTFLPIAPAEAGYQKNLMPLCMLFLFL